MPGRSVRCVWDLGAELAEGPVWRQDEKSLWFVDIKGRAIHQLSADDGQTRSWTCPEPVGFIAPVQGGGWIAGLRSGPHRFDPRTGQFVPCGRFDNHPESHRLNDGYVDSTGRLWFGTMHDGEQGRDGCLYSLEADGTCRVRDGGYGIANGPTVSADGRVLYHTDTAERVIYAFDLAPDGTLSGKRVFVRIQREGAYPDGCFADAEGCVWTALFGGWGLERYSATGDLIDYIRLPVANVTKAAFGGPSLKTLYATTAWLHLSADERARQPLAGAVFAIDVDVPGLPQNQVRIGI